MYMPFPKNSTKPLSLNSCNCCLIFALILLFCGCLICNSFSNIYISFIVNTCAGSLLTQFKISISQPRLFISLVSSLLLLLTFSTTLFASNTTPLETIDILPCLGILSIKILQPTQPARRAVSGNGLRFSIISGTMHTAVASGRWCGGQWPQCGLSGHHKSAH